MESKRHMLEGIACLEKGAAETAITHFDRAVELRECGPWQHHSESAWVLAAAWINRSDALGLLGRKEEAIISLDRAIDAMGHVPLDSRSSYIDRLILAWLNRATTCGELGKANEAFTGFSNAETLLDGLTLTPARSQLRLMLHVNRAKLLLDLGIARGGWEDSRAALGFLSDPPAGEDFQAAIQASGIHCRALAMLLDEPGGLLLESDWIARATDAVEEALSLVRSSRCHGEWLADLVRYGAHIYRVCQPHFLGEFIREWTCADGPFTTDILLKREMLHELLLAKVDLERRVRRQSHDTGLVERELRTLATLQQTERELADFKEKSKCHVGKMANFH